MISDNTYPGALSGLLNRSFINLNQINFVKGIGYILVKDDEENVFIWAEGSL